MADKLSLERNGSVLLTSLGKAFGEVLLKDIERELQQESKKKEKEKQKQKKKTKKSKKKDERKEDKKPKRELEEKRVVREGRNSLITYPSASSFSVFSHIRHFVLQTQLCETYNSRIGQESGGESEEEGEEEGGKKEEIKMPVVVGLGVRGVFMIIRDIWRSQPELCLRALKEFLNILQGQSPARLKNEPTETTGALFDLLMQMIMEPSTVDGDHLSAELSSVASACLLSLVVALGDTGKMLAAVAAMLTTPPELSESTVQIPQIFYALQGSVQAVLLGEVVETNWNCQGVPAKSVVELWPLNHPTGGEGGEGGGEEGTRAAALASDGQYLYLHGTFGLLKVGSGYGNTKKGFVYQEEKDFHTDESGWLGYASGKLYYFPLGVGDDTISVVNTDTLKVEGALVLEVDAMGPQTLFADGEGLGQIKAKKEGGFMLRKFTTLCSPLVCVEEAALQLSQKCILCMGRAKYNSQGSLHTLYQSNSEQVVRIMASRNFAAVQTASGKVLYTGSGSVFGVTSKDVPKGEWRALDLPDKNVKVEYCACDSSGCFSLVVSDKGTVYFGGLNKKGEAGEAVGRGPMKPLKLKRVAKLKEQEIVSVACGAHTTAMISKDGKLFMFGSVEDDLVDSSSVVTSMLGVPASQVAMGKAHTVVLTQHGTIFTFGSNNCGQCGRNYVPSKEENIVEEQEEESSSDDEMTMCAVGDHKWGHKVCMVCKFCGYCTGYGPGCCNEGLPGREPEGECGCGSGDSGCSECGCCRVCAGEKDRWGGGLVFEEMPFGEEFERIRQIRDRLQSKREKRKLKSEKKEEKGEMGLQLLFGGEPSVEKEPSEEAAPNPELSTKKPAVVTLPDDMTAMHIDCGTFHTAVLLHSGEVYAFGNNNHGQLGQGNNKVSGHPVIVPLPSPATHLACGDNHTVVLLQSGEVFTFGRHQEGQLGRKKGEEDDETWYMVPRPVPMLGEECKATWVGASGNQTFISVDESLVSESALSRCKVFASPQAIGLVAPVSEGAAKPAIIMIDREELKARKFDGEDQQSLVGCGVCVDPEYNVLWSFSPHSGKVACFNPIAADIEDSSGTILSTSICLPRSKEAHTSRSHMALNLLSCMSTLATCPLLTIEALAGSRMRKYDKEEFNCIVRFNAHGGGWGYSASSVEAIRFTSDTDILLGGFGLYGGRGTYNAEIKVFDLGESGGDSEPEGTLLASQTEMGYSCERQQTYRVMFDKPVLLVADHWYVAYAAVSSPSGASSDAGSSGQSELQGPDKVVFKIKSSKRSNNGTDVGSGQIPEFLYKIPEIEQEDGVQIQLLDRDFSCTVSPDGLNAVLRLLDWSWAQLTQPVPPDARSLTQDPQHLAFVAKAALGLLKTYILEAYPEKGKIRKPDLDCPELAAAVFEARTLLRLILSYRGMVVTEDKHSPIALVLDACCSAFRMCFNAFYPSIPLKWFALCQQLQYLDPHDVVTGVPMENLLSAILEALAQPTVSYIGLGYDTSISINAAIYNSEPDQRFPVLSEYLQMKTLEEDDGGELLGFNAVASKLLAVVTAPIHSALVSRQPQIVVSPVVSKAGQLLLSRINELALCIAYPESAVLSGLPITKTERKEKVFESSVRFLSKECGYPSLNVNSVVFSVNKPILLHGVTVYGSTDTSYQYKMSLTKNDEPLSTTKGSFSHSDYYGESFVNLLFKEAVKLEPEVVYSVHLELTGSVYDIGVEGKTSLSGPGGVTFTLQETGIVESDPQTGPVAKFLYAPSAVSSPQNVVQLSVHLATTLLEVTMGFLERILQEELSPPLLGLLGESFLFSTLLPTTLAQLGPVACRQPKYAVEVLDLVKHTLPVISVAAKCAGQASPGDRDSGVYSDTNHLHYATLETEHPYKQACVVHHKVKFMEKVQWMSLEFDPRTGFAQREDKLGELLIPRKSSLLPPPPGKQATPPSPLVGVGCDDLHTEWDRYALEYPPGLVLLPGNEVHIVVNTDTEYEKKDSNNHFGLKCQVVGYEWTSDPSECLLFLEKELVTLGAMCAASLLKEDTVLPFAEELSVSGNSGDTEKADMRIVQAAAQEVLGKHCQVLGRGLMVEMPTIHQILRGDIPVISDNSEQVFLRDFIESKSGTAGGRLARWLQPDRAVDPEASELVVPSDPVQVGTSAEFTVCTKDQDGKPVFVEGMKVEVKAVWLGRREGEERVSRRDKMVDGAMGVRRPTFKRTYNATRLNSNYLYNSINMMMPYSDYSFEELRLFAPKVKRSSENMPLKSNKDGFYVATWVPSTSGNYIVQVFIDGRETGHEQKLYVCEPEISEEGEEGEEREGVLTLATQESQEETNIFKLKMKVFPGVTAGGLRIRAEPSFLANAVGLIKPGESFSYVEEIENDSGKWVKLSGEAVEQFECQGTVGYALSYSSERKQSFLEEKEPPIEVTKTKKPVTAVQKPSVQKWKGGPGTYQVVQCGTAGHNVRSKPGMKGTPVGRLAKGNKIEVLEEVENDDGIWLKLAKDSIKKYCETDIESWTLAVGPSGRIFLAMEGDDSYQSQVIDTQQPPEAPKNVFPTAAQVFGTSQKSIFGTPIIPPPPPFLFGGAKPLKLQFGAEQPQGLFKFTSGKKDEEKATKEKESEESEKPKEIKKLKKVKKLKEEAQGQESPPDKPSFSMGSMGPGRSSRSPRWVRRRSSRSRSVSPTDESKKGGQEKEEKEKAPSPVAEPELELPKVIPVQPKQALSPAVAECQRAIFAAFLWQEGLVHDAMASASYLKFHSELTKEMGYDPMHRRKEKEKVMKEEKGEKGEQKEERKEKEEEEVAREEKQQGGQEKEPGKEAEKGKEKGENKNEEEVAKGEKKEEEVGKEVAKEEAGKGETKEEVGKGETKEEEAGKGETKEKAGKGETKEEEAGKGETKEEAGKGETKEEVGKGEEEEEEVAKGQRKEEVVTEGKPQGGQERKEPGKEEEKEGIQKGVENEEEGGEMGGKKGVEKMDGEEVKEKRGGTKIDEKLEAKQGEGEKAKTPDSPKVPVLTLSAESEPTSKLLSLPPTLNHLVTFWDEMTTKILDNVSLPFPPPKVPTLAQELQKRYEEEKKEIEKRKKEKDKKVAPPAGGGGSTVCELCDQSFQDPVTYHMKESHPGCGKHASGWGYNSRGTFCSGWAGNCGDGGRGGSTWYLMCKDCHSKYLALKDEAKKKAVKSIPLPKMKTRKPGKPRSLPVVSAVRGMIQNAKFLLEISHASETQSVLKQPLTPSSAQDFSRMVSIPEDKSGSLRQDRMRQVSFEMPAVFEKPLSAIQRPAFLRSVSMAVGTEKLSSKRTQSDSGEEESPQVPHQHTLDETTPQDAPDMGSLMLKPSKNLRRLMYNRSRQCQESKEIGYGRVLMFVLRYHDLDGLRVSMKQAMRVAGIRTFAMEFLEWLLQKVEEPSIVHDILWQFNCALASHPVQQMAARMKAEREREEKGQKNEKPSESEDWPLGRHPLTGLDGAGVVLYMLRREFHSFLQTVATIMPRLPVGSAVQQVAMQCYCLHFQPQDHSFLLQSNVFTNISKALSSVEDSEGSAGGEKRTLRDRAVDVILMENVLPKGRLKVSSNDAMSNSLTDGSTETFWESRDEPRGRPRQLTVTFEEEQRIFAAAVHIDNQKDSGQRVESVTLLVGRDEDCLKEVDKVKLSMMQSGWRMLMAPPREVCSMVRVEVKGLQNNVRVRQLQVLARPVRGLETTYPAPIAQQKACEAEALRVFRLLTSQVFGGLLMLHPSEDQDEPDAAPSGEGEKEEEVREHVVDILFSKNKLSSLQKQVCMHIIQSVHTEMERMKDEWETAASKPPPPKPSRQTSTEPAVAEAVGKSSDTYCYELLSMLIGLSQSDVGCAFLSEQEKLVQDLFTMLHTASTRIQLQICSILRRILPVIGAKNLAPMLSIRILPPLGYSAIAEAVNSAATINQLGILDCLLSIVAKALSVQVRAKGRSTNILQLLTGDSGISALTLACLVNPKPVPGETTVRAQRWYLKGTVPQEVAREVVKLLKDMIKGSLGAQWEGYAKSAIGQAILHLTKVPEEARVPIPGMYSQTLWLCLAALCVIDEEHAEALSSGQWLGQDGKPKAKPLCDNHDDGETQALILCDKCGNLCGECDRVLHYRRNTRDHQRQVFKEEEEAVKVELHEGCGRIKLYWTMALADYRTLKGMIEFRETGSSGGKGSCRFCGTTSNTGLLAIGNVCVDPECQERAGMVCDKTLSCGHICCGVKGEEKCLPCLNGCSSGDPKLKQDADDMCMICYTEGLSCAPCIQLECGHVFHYHCCRNALTKRWSGPRITFRFMFCSICENTPIAHSKLSDVLDPVMELFEDVKRKCLMRLEYENQMKCEAIASPSSKFYQKPFDYAMWKYAYYVCYKCKKAYYGGEARCAEQASASDDYDPTELVCPACANVGGTMQVCPKHGTDFLEYKCRYCCSVAIYFCFGTTHFCTPCHDDFQRLTGMAKSELPQCPVGPCARPLEGTECPLHVKHPPTGEEFALGCGVCRNAQTF